MNDRPPANPSRRQILKQCKYILLGSATLYLAALKGYEKPSLAKMPNLHKATVQVRS
jgi:hypothetical protein